MKAIERMLAEIKLFDGESFTLVDVAHFRFAKHYLRLLVRHKQVAVSPERTHDGKAIYRHTGAEDYALRLQREAVRLQREAVRQRRKERVRFHKNIADSNLTKKLICFTIAAQ